MNATEIAQEAMRLSVTERNRIIASLVMANMRDEQAEWSELQRRMDDRNPESWVPLDEVKAKLLASGLD